ncbi:MAG: hypothetical protein F4152_02450 [Dehalococcoidia bacterium]|nr:hypothetical protein [Dehalococcoidia bacterium]
MHPQKTSVKAQRTLSDEQEQIRLRGLRILARIIARHALTHHDQDVKDSAGRTSGPAHGAKLPDDHAG